ncbi:MAG: LPS export ABC transporter periplasmic protein LptC [Bacteroides sp.]|nr:LPS export ABC transporter periplasmic protein LptC [Ruminococcus flavefaciens]MCM1555354.1 LPS export ABC transporter periplasmic protein LptC [Bacteroides sp.]
MNKGLSIILSGMTAAFLLCSCQDRKAVFMPFDDISTAPGQTVYGSSTLATEAGKAQVFMEYPVMSNYTGEEADAEPHQVFPKGIKSTFFNEDGSTVDVLMFADSAINLQEKKLMKFFGNVQVYDYRSLDTIYTEALFWNQQAKKIYSDVAVRKVSPGLVLEGDGFDSDERMENVVLRRPRGVIR